MRCLCCSVNRVKRALHRFALWQSCFVFSFPLSLTMRGKWEVGCAATLEGSDRFGLVHVLRFSSTRTPVKKSKTLPNPNPNLGCHTSLIATLLFHATLKQMKHCFKEKKSRFLIEVYGRITHMPLFRHRLFSEHCSSLMHKKQSLQKPNSCNFSNFFFPKSPLIPSLMMVINKVTLWQLWRMLNHWERQSDVGERRQRNFFPPYSEKFYLCSLNSLEQHTTPHN